MRSLWNETEAQGYVDRYARMDIGADLALRVYTTRLLGQDTRLVLHGGGNTSVKTETRDLLGDNVDTLCVKGSGCDMATIELAGLPAVRLAPLRRLRALDALADADMVRIQRANLIDPMAPHSFCRDVVACVFTARLHLAFGGSPVRSRCHGTSPSPLSTVSGYARSPPHIRL